MPQTQTIEDTLLELPYVPKWLGIPMYPYGYPVDVQACSYQTDVDGPVLSIRERITQYHLNCIDKQGNVVENPPLTQEDFEVLQQWAVYFLHAPEWVEHELLDEARQLAINCKSWSDLQRVNDVAMGAGLAFL